MVWYDMIWHTFDYIHSQEINHFQARLVNWISNIQCSIGNDARTIVEIVLASAGSDVAFSDTDVLDTNEVRHNCVDFYSRELTLEFK